MKQYNTKSIAYTGVFAAFAIIISYVEYLLPINLGIPGVKPGFANFIILLAIFELNSRDAFIINFIRISVVGLLFGNMFSILFSLAGALISFVVMVMLKHIKTFSITGISICGGVSHNIGQLIIAAFIVNTYSIMYYVPVLIVAGIITGFLVGILANTIQPPLHKILHS